MSGLDELGKIANDLLGAARNAGKDAEGVLKDRLERVILQLDLVPRDEFEALKARMANLEEGLKKQPVSKSSAKKAVKKPAKKPTKKKS